VCPALKAMPNMVEYTHSPDNIEHLKARLPAESLAVDLLNVVGEKPKEQWPTALEQCVAEHLARRILRLQATEEPLTGGNEN